MGAGWSCPQGCTAEVGCAEHFPGIGIFQGADTDHLHDEHLKPPFHQNFIPCFSLPTSRNHHQCHDPQHLRGKSCTCLQESRKSCKIWGQSPTSWKLSQALLTRGFCGLACEPQQDIMPHILPAATLISLIRGFISVSVTVTLHTAQAWGGVWVFLSHSSRYSVQPT